MRMIDCSLQMNQKITIVYVFLDVLLIKNEENIETDWYTKPTFSGRLLRGISEMLQIKIQKQPINKQEDTQKLSFMYTNTL